MARRRPARSALPHWLESAREPAFLIDSDGRLAAMNASCVRWLGLTDESWRDRSPHPGNLQSPDETDRRLAGIAFTPEPAGIQALSLFASGADGQPVPAAAVALPLHVEEDSQPWSLIWVDLTGATLPQKIRPDSTADFRAGIARQLGARRAAAPVYSLLGSSAAAERLRLQTQAAVSAALHLRIRGPVGSEREQLVRLVHARRHAGSSRPPPLTAIQCRAADQSWLQEVIRQTLAERNQFDPPVVNLLLLDVELLDGGCQSELAGFLRINPDWFRLFSTASTASAASSSRQTAEEPARPPLDETLEAHLSAQTIDLLPLRQRLADIPAIATALLDAATRRLKLGVCRLGPETTELLAEYWWPGDVQELADVITAAARSRGEGTVAPTDLPESFRIALSARRPARLPVERVDLDGVLASVERELILRALAVCRRNRAEAARLLGINRARLVRRCEQLRLFPSAEPREPEPIEFVEAPPDGPAEDD